MILDINIIFIIIIYIYIFILIFYKKFFYFNLCILGIYLFFTQIPILCSIIFLFCGIFFFVIYFLINKVKNFILQKNWFNIFFRIFSIKLILFSFFIFSNFTYCSNSTNKFLSSKLIDIGTQTSTILNPLAPNLVVSLDSSTYLKIIAAGALGVGVGFAAIKGFNYFFKSNHNSDTINFQRDTIHRFNELEQRINLYDRKITRINEKIDNITPCIQETRDEMYAQKAIIKKQYRELQKINNNTDNLEFDLNNFIYDKFDDNKNNIRCEILNKTRDEKVERAIKEVKNLYEFKPRPIKRSVSLNDLDDKVYHLTPIHKGGKLFFESIKKDSISTIVGTISFDSLFKNFFNPILFNVFSDFCTKGLCVTTIEAVSNFMVFLYQYTIRPPFYGFSHNFSFLSRAWWKSIDGFRDSSNILKKDLKDNLKKVDSLNNMRNKFKYK